MSTLQPENLPVSKYEKVDWLGEPGRYRMGEDPERPSVTEHPYAFQERILSDLQAIFSDIYQLRFEPSKQAHQVFHPAMISKTDGIKDLIGESYTSYLVGGDHVTEYFADKERFGPVHKLSLVDTGIPYISDNLLRLAPTQRDGQLHIVFRGALPTASTAEDIWLVDIAFTGSNPGNLISHALSSLGSFAEEKGLQIWRNNLVTSGLNPPEDPSS